MENSTLDHVVDDVHSKHAALLQQKIKTHQANIGILGLGYVGLPLAMAFAKNGFTVSGFEVDPGRIRSLLAGRSYIADVPNVELADLIEKRRFVPITDFSRLGTMDVVIICVPTPLNKTKDPDISFVASAADYLARYIHKQQLVVLESTTYPGTTREFLMPRLQKRGLRVGRDIFLAFSPERIDPGNTQFSLENTPKVVGGITPACRDLTVQLYGEIVKRVVPVSSAEAAEMVKILENTFRAVNIGLVNEMALICDKLQLNVWEIIEAAASKPYGFMPFYPGPGLGGHCIPVDPHYLSWKMKALNFSARFIELAGEVNTHMPEFVVEKTMRALNARKKPLNGSTIVLLGMAYKANVSDARESPSLDIYQLFRHYGAKVEYCDPFVPAIKVEGAEVAAKSLTPTLLKGADAVVIATSHTAFDPSEILKHATLVVDTRNLCRGHQEEHLIRL